MQIINDWKRAERALKSAKKWSEHSNKKDIRANKPFILINESDLQFRYEGKDENGDHCFLAPDEFLDALSEVIEDQFDDLRDEALQKLQIRVNSSAKKALLEMDKLKAEINKGLSQ